MTDTRTGRLGEWWGNGGGVACADGEHHAPGIVAFRRRSADGEEFVIRRQVRDEVVIYVRNRGLLDQPGLKKAVAFRDEVAI